MDSCPLSCGLWVSAEPSLNTGVVDLMDRHSLTEKFDFSHAWMRWGATGLTAFTLATILSVRFIRNAFFEFFLVSHIILVG